MRRVDRVIVINLDRRPDKFAAWVGAARVMNVPSEIVERFSAVDGLDFLDRDEIIHLAVQEFPFWSRIDADEGWFRDFCGRGSLAMRLSFQRVLKSIAEIENQDSLSIFVLDHFYFCRDWSVMVKGLEALPEFDIFQMWCWDAPGTPLSPNYPQFLESDPSVSYGLAGAGDVCLTLSPLGAQEILEWWSRKPYFFMDYVLHSMSKSSLLEQARWFSAAGGPAWARGVILLEPYGFGPDSERLAIDGLDG